jgi:hypothetical protein
MFLFVRRFAQASQDRGQRSAGGAAIGQPCNNWVGLVLCDSAL